MLSMGTPACRLNGHNHFHMGLAGITWSSQILQAATASAGRPRPSRAILMDGQGSERAPLTRGEAARPAPRSCKALPRSSCNSKCVSTQYMDSTPDAPFHTTGAAHCVRMIAISWLS